MRAFEATDPAPLTLDVVHIDDGAVGIAVAGDVDACTADQLQTCLLDAIGRYRPRSVVIDCADMAFLDAAGIGALIRARNYAAGQRAEIRLINTGRLVTRILTVAGLVETFNVTPLS